MPDPVKAPDAPKSSKDDSKPIRVVAYQIGAIERVTVVGTYPDILSANMHDRMVARQRKAGEVFYVKREHFAKEWMRELKDGEKYVPPEIDPDLPPTTDRRVAKKVDYTLA